MPENNAFAAKKLFFSMHFSDNLTNFSMSWALWKRGVSKDSRERKGGGVFLNTTKKYNKKIQQKNTTKKYNKIIIKIF